MIGSRPSISRSSNSSRVSNNSSVNSSMISKTIYPKCNAKKQHSKQVLNLICVTSSCKANGPICSQCKSSDHSTHLVLPIKTFLQKVKDKLEETQVKKVQGMEKKEEVCEGKVEMVAIQEKSNAAKYMETIQSNKNEMLSMLSYTVQQIAKQLQAVEEKIINEAESLIALIECSRQAEQSLEKTVEQFLDSPPEQCDPFKNKMKSLLSIVTMKNKQTIEIGGSYAQKVESYTAMSSDFETNVERWLDNSLRDINDLFKPTEKVKKTDCKNLKFSEIKSKSIVLASEAKVAKQNQSKQVGFATLTGSPLKDKSLTIKISNLAVNIKVGICLKDIIKSKGYKMNPNAIGHGSFMIANNTYTYSHSDPAYNMVMKGFGFNTNDLIEISYHKNELKFQNKTGQKKFSLPLKKMAENEEKQLAYCVWLGGIGDKVEIVG